ncbi:hypothetical protein NXW59_22420 [Bacteroides fragilis]|nr:hypothetical protein [Bacteroides fragilis]
MNIINTKDWPGSREEFPSDALTDMEAEFYLRAGGYANGAGSSRI